MLRLAGNDDSGEASHELDQKNNCIYLPGFEWIINPTPLIYCIIMAGT
jgi:hypothetical protein